MEFEEMIYLFVGLIGCLQIVLIVLSLVKEKIAAKNLIEVAKDLDNNKLSKVGKDLLKANKFKFWILYLSLAMIGFSIFAFLDLLGIRF